MVTDAPVTQPPSDNRFRESFLHGLRNNWFNYLLFVVVVMALAGLVVAITGINQTAQQNRQLTRLVDCQNSYNEVNNERTRQLAVAAERTAQAEAATDTALGNLVTNIARNDTKDINESLKILQQALAEKKAARDQTIQERRAHPVPPPPKALCGNKI